MTRVSSVVMLIIALLAAPLAVEAQPVGKVYRIGYLTQGTVMDGSTTDRRILGAFTDGLRQLGYVDGRNLRVEWREARGDNGRLPALAEELVRLHPDVIVTIASAPDGSGQAGDGHDPSRRDLHGRPRRDDAKSWTPRIPLRAVLDTLRADGTGLGSREAVTQGA